MVYNILLLVSFSLVFNPISAHFDQLDELRATYTKCESDGDCTENAVCHHPNGYCQCKKGFVNFEDLCLKSAVTLGDPCLGDIQCEVTFGSDSECASTAVVDARVCRCKEGSHFADNKCHQSSLLGEKCKTRSDCYVISGANVYCVHSICTCHQEYHPNSERNECFKSVLLGETCSTNDDCVPNNSSCYGTCSCQAAFVPATDKRRCLKVAHELGDSCELDAQCLQFLPLTACRSQRCACQEGSHENQRKCWRTSDLGQPCDDWRQCKTMSNVSGSVTCDVTKRCRCTPGFITSDNKDDCRANSSLSTSGNAILTSVLCLAVFVLQSK